MKHGEGLERQILGVLRAFKNMEVIFLPDESDGTVLMGRGPEAALALGDASVSKVHARLSWGPQGLHSGRRLRLRLRAECAGGGF